jgi:hypothetical protein
MAFDLEATDARISRMITALSAPLGVNSDYLRRLNNANAIDVLDDWRTRWLAYFESLSARIRDPSESTDDDAQHLLRWMDWDLLLSEARGDLTELATEIQSDLAERESAPRS